MELPGNFPTSVWDGLSNNTARPDRTVFQTPDGDDWDRIVAEVIATQTRVGIPSLGTKNGSAVAVTETVGSVNKTVLTLTDLEIAITDATTAGAHGSHKVYDFPEGAFLLLGAVMNLTTLAGAGGIADNAQLVGSLGTATVATDNATLAGTGEADIIPSTAGTLSSGAGTLKAVTTTALVAIIDGTGGAKDLFLNIAIPDAGVTDDEDDTITVNGTITITWAFLGDK